MTGLEALKIVEKDCEDLEQVPYGEFALIKKELQAFSALKKYFNFSFDNLDWAKLVSIQSKEDAGSWDTTATADFEKDVESFFLLKEVTKKWNM